MISGHDTIAHLLDAHPELVEVLAGHHPHFEALRNPRLRRVMAPRTTLAQAAAMAGLPVDELLALLRRAVGEASPSLPSASSETASPLPGTAPGAIAPPHTLAGIPEDRRVHLDVREDIRRGQEPFGRIMAAIKALAEGSVLVLRVPFEPIPLYEILGQRGLTHWTERHAPDDWSVWFYRQMGPPPTSRAPSAGGTMVDGERSVLDVRGLEPPQPMVRVLEAVERLAPGATLEVRHERPPVFLYPQLEERGCIHETDEPEPGLVRIVIRRSGA